MNKRGRLVSERLAWARAVVDADDAFPDWAAEGRAIVGALRDVVHAAVDPRTVDEARVRNWQRYGWVMEATAHAGGRPAVNEWLPANRDAAAKIAAGG